MLDAPGPSSDAPDMRAPSLVWAFALVACAGAASPPPRASRRVPDVAPSAGDPELVAALERARADFALPGAAVLVVDGDDERSATVGFRVLPTAEPLAPSDRFHLGSDGKAMVATVLAVLIAEGLVSSWDATLSSVLNDVTFDPRFEDVTLAEIAAHRSGLPRDPEVDDDERAAILAVTDERAQRDLVVRRELGRPPATPRGELVYSNVGFVILGEVIERASGVPFTEAVRQRLFEPLEMSSCSFEVPEGDGRYGHSADGTLADASTLIPLAYLPAGGVHCTMADWARFVRAHLTGERGGSSLLTPDQWRALHTPPEGASYAFGWNITTTSEGRLLAHAGSNGYWMAVVRVALDRDRAVMFATNIGDVDLDRLEPVVHQLGGIAAP